MATKRKTQTLKAPKRAREQSSKGAKGDAKSRQDKTREKTISREKKSEKEAEKAQASRTVQHDGSISGRSKKKPSPKPAKTKPRKSSHATRSLAAKRGWETRRRKKLEGVSPSPEALAKREKRHQERQASYTPFTTPPRPKASLTPDEAESRIASLIDRLAQYYRRHRLGVFPAIVQNKDHTVDGEIVISTMTLAAESDDQADAVRRVVMMAADAVPNTFSEEIWFSTRIDFVAGAAVDENGDVFGYNTKDLDELGGEFLDADRWSGDRLQLRWQRGREPFYGHMQGAYEAVSKVLEAMESFYPVVSAISIKFHWNPFVAQPAKLRLLHETSSRLWRRISRAWRYEELSSYANVWR